MSCNICQKTAKETLSCSTCKFEGCRECLTHWYRKTKEKADQDETGEVKPYTCPQCRTQNTFEIEIETDEETNEETNINWRHPGIMRGSIITPEQYQILPPEYKNHWNFIPQELEIDGIIETVGYLIT